MRPGFCLATFALLAAGYHCLAPPNDNDTPTENKKGGRRNFCGHLFCVAYLHITLISR